MTRFGYFAGGGGGSSVYGPSHYASRGSVHGPTSYYNRGSNVQVINIGPDPPGTFRRYIWGRNRKCCNQYIVNSYEYMMTTIWYSRSILTF